MTIAFLVKKLYLLWLFRRYSKKFFFKAAENKREVNQALHIRWCVYGKQAKYIDAKKYPRETFHDEFDKHAIQIICYYNKKPVGSFRVVLDSDMGLPVEKYYNIKIPKKHRGYIGEISRFAVLKEYRGGQFGRVPSLGMLITAFEESCKANLKFWYIFLPQQLKESFIRFGAEFIPVKEGPLSRDQQQARLLLGSYFERTMAKPYRISIKQLGRIIDFYGISIHG